MEPVLRRATVADVPALLLLWQRAAENSDRPADDESMVRRLLDRDPDAVVLAEIDDRLVGSVVAGWDGWRAHVYRLAVDPDLRGQGLAGRLLERAEQRLRDLGAERFCAMVLEDNEAGRRWWRAAGYTPQDGWRRWVRTP